MPKVIPQMSYADAMRKLDGKNRARVNGGNAVLERGDDGDIIYRLWDTAIITYHGDNTATLDSGGHMTATTKRHMCAAVRVSQEKFVWYVGNQEFYDGMRVTL